MVIKRQPQPSVKISPVSLPVLLDAFLHTAILIGYDREPR